MYSPPLLDDALTATKCPISKINLHRLQRHKTEVPENPRVFDEKYPGIFKYPGFMMSHYRGIDKSSGIFNPIPGDLTACQTPG